jgi:UDP-N-acetylglucosamine 3-dehydrogenase
MKTAIRFGLIGLGNWGQQHLHQLAGLPCVEVRWICDADGVLAEATAQRSGIPHWTTEWEEIMADPQVDAVCVVTPEHAHLAPVKAALAAGKHVLVEKPIAPTAEEAEEMIAAASTATSFIMPGHVMRFDPRFSFLHRRIRAGKLGRVVSIKTQRHIRQNLTRARARHHIAYRLAVHDIDLALWFAGSPVVRVRGYHRAVQYPDIVDFSLAVLEHANGALSSIEVSSLMPSEEMLVIYDLTVIGEKETYSLPLLKDLPDLMSLQEGHVTPDVLLLPASPGLVSGSLGTEIAYFVNCIAKDVPPDHVTLHEALDALRVAWAIAQSCEEGRPVEL